jgi:hypothetical protein
MKWHNINVCELRWDRYNNYKHSIKVIKTIY